MTPIVADAETQPRLSRLDVLRLDPPPRLIVNPHAGQKLGLSTNTGTVEAVERVLAEVGLHAHTEVTRSANHATQLARQAAREGCKLVIAAGGDGTVSEATEALVDTETALGIMPLGSIMNTARTLCIPRDLAQAAATIVDGRVLAMDVGRVGDRLFLEAGGVGLAAGLFGYFNRLDSGHVRLRGVLRGAWRFLRSLGTPRLVIIADGRRFDVRAPMVTVSNAPYVGAAYALAPEARVDDGLLEVIIFRETGVVRILLHLALIAGGRRLPPPPRVQLVRARDVEIATRRRRPLPVHIDGAAAGVTPARFQIKPGALKVVVGAPDAGAACAWATE